MALIERLSYAISDLRTPHHYGTGGFHVQCDTGHESIGAHILMRGQWSSHREDYATDPEKQYPTGLSMVVQILRVPVLRCITYTNLLVLYTTYSLLKMGRCYNTTMCIIGTCQ